MRWEYLEMYVMVDLQTWSDSVGRNGRLLTGTGITVQGSKGEPFEWQTMGAALNEAGSQGWELVALTRTDPGSRDRYRLLFKRPRD